LAFIQLISDFQTGAYKIGIMKQALLNTLENIDIIDINHDIRLNNINEAAFISKQLLTVDKTLTITCIQVGMAHRLIIYQQNLHWYILPDNGILSLMFDINDLSNLYSFNNNNQIQAIQAILNQDTIPKSGAIILKSLKKPMIDEKRIICERIYTNKLGNCYFNLQKEEFEAVFGNFSFNARIQFVPSVNFSKINLNIFEQDQGGATLTFSKKGFLKLAIYNGNAAQLFRIKEDTKLIIDKL